MAPSAAGEHRARLSHPVSAGRNRPCFGPWRRQAWRPSAPLVAVRLGSGHCARSVSCRRWNPVDDTTPCLGGQRASRPGHHRRISRGCIDRRSCHRHLAVRRHAVRGLLRGRESHPQHRAVQHLRGVVGRCAVHLGDGRRPVPSCEPARHHRARPATGGCWPWRCLRSFIRSLAGCRVDVRVPVARTRLSRAVATSGAGLAHARLCGQPRASRPSLRSPLARDRRGVRSLLLGHRGVVADCERRRRPDPGWPRWTCFQVRLPSFSSRLAEPVSMACRARHSGPKSSALALVGR